MLKARLIASKGDASIYYKDNPDRTLSLNRCIELIFTNNKDPLRLNLERIIELRNTSTHFITEEYEQIYIPLFQSCVLNFTQKMLEFFQKDITETIPANFLTLSVKLSLIDPEEIQARYPKQIANRLLKSQKKIIESLPTNGNDRYAVLIKHEIYLTKKSDLATTIVSITKNASEAAYIFKEPKDMQKLCPHKRKKCLEIINYRLKKAHINFINPTKPENDEQRHVFNSYHFNLIEKFYNFKSNPKYCYKYENGTQPLYSYSESFLEKIIEEIKKDPEHIIEKLKAQIKK